MVDAAGQQAADGSDEQAQRNEWIATYRAACREYQLNPCPDVLACFRLGSPDLVLHRWPRAVPFGDLDLNPLLDTFEDCPEAFSQLRTMKLTNAKLGPSSTTLLASQLSLPHCRLETFGYKKMWPRRAGAQAIVDAVRACRSLTCLDLSRCSLRDDGVEPLLSLLKEGREAHNLKKLNLGKNGLSFDVGTQLQAACESHGIEVDLSGNYILHEVLNAATHGLGVVLAIVGTVFMALAVQGKPRNYIASVVVYSVALHVRYLASTLYHCFTLLGSRVLRVFGILDHISTSILIFGSFCPFIWIHLPDKIWILGLLFAGGIGCIATMVFHDGLRRRRILITLYLIMGWSALLGAPGLLRRIDRKGVLLAIFGGVLYSAGVPFYVKQKRTFGLPDHTIWHLFCLAGSVAHYLSILWYCLSVDPNCPGGTCLAMQ